MKIVHIFGPEDGPQAWEGLWAVEYEPGMGNAFDNLCDLWDDVEWMRGFCRAHHADLQTKFGGPISVNAAVNELMDEADLLMTEVLNLAEGTEQGKALQEAFKPLDNSHSNLRELQLSRDWQQNHEENKNCASTPCALALQLTWLPEGP